MLYFEYQFDDTQRIRPLGHWLVYLQLIKYFLPKTAEDDWFLFLLGLMQVLIGVGRQPERPGRHLAVPLGDAGGLGARPVLPPARGAPILSRRSRASPAPPVLRAHRPVDPYRGPVRSALRRSRRHGSWSTTLALGGLIFLVLPRQAGATRIQAGAPMARHLTGFDEEVQLGQLGEILENDSVVMTVELTDETARRSGPMTSRSGAASPCSGTRRVAGTASRRRHPVGRQLQRPTAGSDGQADPPEDQARADRLSDLVRHPADPDATSGPPVAAALQPNDGTSFGPMS